MIEVAKEAMDRICEAEEQAAACIREAQEQARMTTWSRLSMRLSMTKTIRKNRIVRNVHENHNKDGIS